MEVGSSDPAYVGVVEGYVPRFVGATVVALRFCAGGGRRWSPRGLEITTVAPTHGSSTGVPQGQALGLREGYAGPSVSVIHSNPPPQDIGQRLATIAMALASFPEAVFACLFGSRGSGRPGPLSDVDVAVFLDFRRFEHRLLERRFARGRQGPAAPEAR